MKVILVKTETERVPYGHNYTVCYKVSEPIEVTGKLVDIKKCAPAGYSVMEYNEAADKRALNSFEVALEAKKAELAKAIEAERKKKLVMFKKLADELGVSDVEHIS